MLRIMSATSYPVNKVRSGGRHSDAVRYRRADRDGRGRADVRFAHRADVGATSAADGRSRATAGRRPDLDSRAVRPTSVLRHVFIFF